jgi:hypothetical protein
MNTSMRTRVIFAVLAVSAIAPVAPAAAGVYGPLDEAPQTGQRNDSPAQTSGSINAIVPPASEPSSVEPGYVSANATTGALTGEPANESTAVLIRDGSQAVPFVANVGPDAAATAGDSADGFDWGDAALGAGVAMAGLFGIGAAVLATRRRTGLSPSASTS